MRAEPGRTVRDDLAESRDKPSDDRSRTLDTGWGDGDLSSRDLSGRNSRPLARQPAGRLTAPPAAGESLDRDEDAVESLFRADQTLRAPSIPVAPNEAELTRWQATARVSLFDERVSDPVPPPPAGEPRPAAATAPRAGGLPGARTRELASQPSRAADLAPPRSLDEPRQAPPVPVRPPMTSTDVPVTARAAVPARSEVEELESEPPPNDLFEQPAAVEPPAAPPGRRRPLPRGPKPVTLIVLGSAALLTLGSAAVLLGSRDNPGASTPLARMPRAPAEAPAPPPRAAPAPASGSTPARPPAPAAAQPVAPAPALQAPAAAEPAQAEPSQAAPQPAQPAAAAQSAAPQAPVAQPAPAAPQAQAVAPPAPSAQPVAAAPQAKPAAAPAPAAQPARASEPTAVRPPAAQRDVEQVEGDGAADSGKLMTAARKLLADDEPEGAEAMMRDLLARDPQDHHAMELLVRALMDQDRGQDALPFARKMVQRRGRRVPYRLLLGDLLLMVGDEAAARAEWRVALELAPDDREIKRRLGL